MNRIPLGRKILVENGIIDYADQKFHIDQLKLLPFNFHFLSHTWNEAFEHERIERTDFDFLKPIYWQVFIENPEIIFDNFSHLIKNDTYERWAFPFSELNYFGGTTFGGGNPCYYYDSLKINFTKKRLENEFIQPAHGGYTGFSASFCIPFIVS